MHPEPTTTQLLANARAGDGSALDALLPRIYDELRTLAHARIRRYRPGATLNTTALVHEVYLKLTTGETPGWKDRSHFFALAAQAMRFVLVSYARERAALKRGGGLADLPLDEAIALEASDAAETEAIDLLLLDDALTTLAEQSKRLAQVVEYRFFGGLTHEEIAEATGFSVRTVKRDWQRARAWLHQAMHDSPSADDPAAGDSAIEE